MTYYGRIVLLCSILPFCVVHCYPFTLVWQYTGFDIARILDITLVTKHCAYTEKKTRTSG